MMQERNPAQVPEKMASAACLDAPALSDTTPAITGSDPEDGLLCAGWSACTGSVDTVFSSGAGSVDAGFAAFKKLAGTEFDI
jgi:hypothetical protein